MFAFPLRQIIQRLLSGFAETANELAVASDNQARGECKMNASDAMTTNVVTVTPDFPIGKIARFLEQKHIKRVPVLENGQLVGIVSRANLLQAMAAQSKVHIQPNVTNDEKRDIVLGALAQVPGLSPVHLNVVVADNRIDEETAAIVALKAIDDLGDVSVHLDRIPNYAWGI
tara:strand:+ start:1155 stop:1670 length:516 start_codon:yes stop_codon:yes gene_type:complete